ncbi:MAG: GNAT family N-acetyltransferase [Bacilli bacterium]|nr:GNAT family N-acetyltransferase [Bacilli bacterium]
MDILECVSNFFYLLPLETERLFIRKTIVDDVDLLLKIDKQEVTQKFLGGIKNKTKEERVLFLEKKTNSLTVCLKDSTPIGFIDFAIDDSSFLLSYIFDYDYCNKGYCTEACKKIIDVCFNELCFDSVQADTVEGNASSKRVLEKLGFKFQRFYTKNYVRFLKYIIYNKK